jgi:hypothetical protein
VSLEVFFDRESDALERACERIWMEIRSLLPRHRRLHDLGENGRTPEQARELYHLTKRVMELRAETERYRRVLRNEAWARYMQPPKL